MRKKTRDEAERPPARRQPRKVLYVDVGVRVTVPMDLDPEAHHKIIDDIRTEIHHHVNKFLGAYKAKHPHVEFETL